MVKKNKVKRANLKTNVPIIYMLITLLFILAFSFFLSSKYFIEDDSTILNTEIGEEFNLSTNGTFTINEWIYDEQKNKMQITLITSNMISYLSELDFSAVAKVDIQKTLPTEVVYSSNDIYIIDINEVPKNFDQIALRLIKNDYSLEEEFEQTNAQDQEGKKILTSIYADQRAVKMDNIVETNVKEYAVKVTDKMIAESQVEIEEIRKKNDNIMAVNQHINQEINKLKEELIYQTIDEQTQTNNEIFSMKKEIEDNQNDIKDHEINVKSYELKIERLEQRKRDLEF